MITSEMMKPEEWIIGRDTGASSKAIWGVMRGVWGSVMPDVPHDPDDFGRCYRLLKAIPEWRSRLSEMKNHFPKQWGPFVDAWDELEAMYEKCSDDAGQYAYRANEEAGHKMYLRMKEIRSQTPPRPNVINFEISH